jgi:hypothetical protein
MRWRADWLRLLSERNRLSCDQHSATAPSFAATHPSSGVRALSRWLPWNWYSLDGTGWCYDAEWDEMQACAGMGRPVDWNGVGRVRARDDDALTGLQLLVLLLAPCMIAGHIAYQEWRRRHKVQQQDVEGASQARAVSVSSWLAGGRVLPWQWDRRALYALLSGLAGLLLSQLLPLPSRVGPGFGVSSDK